MADRTSVSSGPDHAHPPRGRRHPRVRAGYRRTDDTGLIYPADERAVVLAAETTEAPEHVARALGLDMAARVIRRMRVTRRGDEPIELSTSWYEGKVADRAPALSQPERVLEGTLAYVERVTGRRGNVARDRMSARLATAEERTALDLMEPAAVLVIHHLVCDSDNRPLGFEEAICPPDTWTFKQEYAVHGEGVPG
jgi:DNA-binding GntR family transcriptional regulator